MEYGRFCIFPFGRATALRVLISDRCARLQRTIIGSGLPRRTLEHCRRRHGRTPSDMHFFYIFTCYINYTCIILTIRRLHISYYTPYDTVVYTLCLCPTGIRLFCRTNCDTVPSIRGRVMKRYTAESR